jgi:hypothetical protein
MEEARTTWSDERLDDLARRVDDGFNRVDRRFDAVDQRFDHLEARMNVRFDSMNARFDALQRTMLQFAGAMTIAVLATLASVILTQA